ncbi:MAG: ATPase [Desulfurococcaceae archaeon]
MKILVTGLLTHDSGKTEFISSMIDVLMKHGFKTIYFKPVAGHDGWYQYETILKSIENRILIGHDAYYICEKLGLLSKIHLISPIDVLTLPLDPVKLGFNTHLYEDYMSYTIRKTVLVRYTRIYDDVYNYKNIYFICENTISKINDELNNVLENLINSLKTSNSYFITTNTFIVEKILTNPFIYDVIDSYINFFEKNDFIIIEGYNDVASPTRGSLYSNYVIIVAPGKAILYSGERYRTAVELLSYKGYPWSIRTSRVIEICGKPLKLFNIPLKINSVKLNNVFEDIIDFITRR